MIARSLLLVGSSLVFLSSCTSTPTERYSALPELTFEHLVQIPVHVSEIDLTIDTQRGAKPWDVANDLPTPPDVAVRRYLEQRYKAVGADGLLSLTLEKADIAVEEIPNASSFLQYISLADQTRYTFEIVINVAIQYVSGQPDRNTTLRFVRQDVMDSYVTAAYRDARLQRVLEQVVRDMDEALIREFANEFEIVRDKDIPVHSIAVKTDEPEYETVFRKKYDKMRKSVSNAFDNMNTSSSKNEEQKTPAE